MVWVLVPPDNLGQNKHVESADVPCLDEGSNPSISTNKTFIAEKRRLARQGELSCVIETQRRLGFDEAQ